LPKKIEEICGREQVKNRLKQFIKRRNFPHLLFVGSDGIGKTTIASLFSKEFLGRFFQANYKIVYANVPLTSDEMKQASSDAYVSTSKIGSLAGRKITTPAFIQVRIKPFVQLKALGEVPFKILIVKNFDELGGNQQGFRRLMEIYGSNCRMILITSKISSIIDPIISRCQIFLISSTDFDSFKNLILDISEREALEIDIKVIELLYKLSNGQISYAIDLLQLCSISGNKIDINGLYKNSINTKQDLMRSLLLVCFNGDFPKARELSRTIQSNYKYRSKEIFTLLLKELLKMPFSNFTRNKLINLIADADFRAIDGRDDDIQISNLLSKFCYLSEYL